MAYTSNENEVKLLSDGEYECVIDDIKEKTYGMENKTCLSIQFRVRSDVEQVGKNRIVFETLYKSKETNDYNGKRIGNLLNACGLPVGESKDTIKEVCDFCKGAYLIVGIGTRMNEYLGKNENYVKFYGKTKNGSKASTLSTEPKQEEEISDDMLPF